MIGARIIVTLAAMTALVPLQAHAQSTDAESDKFLAGQVLERVIDAEDQKEAKRESEIHGSVTSTTFVAKDSGGTAGDANRTEDASPATRLFTDLRTQLTAKRILGGSWNVRADARARLAPPCAFKSTTAGLGDRLADLDPNLAKCRVQSGAYGDNEYEIRELYMRREGSALEIQVGRQDIPEMVDVRVDGARLRYALSPRWHVLGFGGLYPSRTSRSLQDDYRGQVLPGIVGAAGEYLYESIYGSVGAAGILPGGEDVVTGEVETPRTFVTGDGFWRPSELIDFYHIAVVDFTGAAGSGLTNLHLGINVKPIRSLRITAAINRVDTETLNVYAQNFLADGGGGDVVENNVTVARISSESARLGVSAAFADRRFEVSTHFQLRRRPEITVCPPNMIEGCDPAAGMGALFPAAQSGEVMLSVVDRRSIAGLRLAASVLQIFDVGDEVFQRSRSMVARLEGSRSLLGDRMEVEADLSYMHSEDTGGVDACTSPLTCFGRATVDVIAGSGLMYYRFSPNWFALVHASASSQTYTTPLIMNPSPNTILSGLMRLAYRF